MKIGVVGIPGMWSSETLADRFESETGFRCLVDPARILFDLERNRVQFEKTDLIGLDALVIKKLGTEYSPDLLSRLDILQFLFERGVRIFSKPASIRSLLDRMSCTVRLNLGTISMPPTVITEDVTLAAQALREFGKAVLKPLYTSKARGMKVIEDGGDAEAEIKAYRDAGNPVIYLQQWIDHSGRDLGIVFLGGKYVGTYARVAQEQSWSTSTLTGGHYEAHEPNADIIDLAQKAQALFDLDFTCVDVVESSKGPLVYEVSAFGGFKGLQEARSLDAATMYTNYVLEKMSHANH